MSTIVLYYHHVTSPYVPFIPSPSLSFTFGGHGSSLLSPLLPSSLLFFPLHSFIHVFHVVCTSRVYKCLIVLRCLPTFNERPRVPDRVSFMIEWLGGMREPHSADWWAPRREGERVGLFCQSVGICIVSILYFELLLYFVLSHVA